MIIQKEILANAIKRIMPGIGKDKTALQGMDTIIIDKGGLHTFNGTICATVPMDTEGIKGAIKGEKFFKLVQKYKAEEVTLEHTEKGLSIKCGKNKSTLAWVTDVKTPEFIEELHNVKPSVELPDDFQEALRLCDIPTNPKDYAGTFVQGNLMMSTDQNRSNIFTFKEGIKDEDGEDAMFWVSLQNGNQLLKLDDKFTHYTTKEKLKDGAERKGVWIHFLTSEGTVFSCTLLNMETVEPIISHMKRFNSMEKEDGAVEGTLPEGFKEVVQRVGSLSARSESKALEYVKLTFTQAALIVSSASSAGSSVEELEWDIKVPEDSQASYLYPVPFLLDIYNKAKDFWMKDMSGGQGVNITTLIFNSGGYKHLVSNLTDPD